MFKKTCLFILWVPFFLILTPYSYGQKYPTKPIEIINPYTPGGPLDLMSRLVAETAPKYLGQPLVVVNKPGAGGSVAAADVISSPPDGYKLFATTNFFFAMTTKTQKIPFDPGSLTPLANFLEMKDGTCVRADSPWKTFNDLLNYGKKNPGKLRWAHAGRGTAAHIAVLVMFRKAGVEAIDVPYKGVADKIAALLGGHVDASTMTYSTVKDHVRDQKMRFLIFNSDHRYGDPPDVPCAVELGFPEVPGLIAYGGLFIHKDASEEIKRTLMGALKKTYEDPDFRRRLSDLSEEMRYEGPEFIRQAIKKGEEVAVPILKELGLYVGK